MDRDQGNQEVETSLADQYKQKVSTMTATPDSAPPLENWHYPEIEERVNGVFKGGGAKGIVYGGALHELRARGIWFKSVTGSSAGAITAVLVAAGLDATQMIQISNEALSQVKVNFFPGCVSEAIERYLERRIWRVGSNNSSVSRCKSI